MQDRANVDRDTAAADIVDACIQLWTRMLIADTVHDNKIVENVQFLQQDCVSMLAELRQCLLKLDRQNGERSSPERSRPPPETTVDSFRYFFDV